MVHTYTIGSCGIVSIVQASVSININQVFLWLYAFLFWTQLIPQRTYMNEAY